jgi:8-oxo-dGTP pyrophosphatase MutT (NUDIX family)
MTIREDIIERAHGERGIYGVVDKEPSCLVIPLETTAEGEFLYLVSQFRYTVGKRLMEFPQGTWEGSDADPITVARGELREETGLRADRMTPLASLQIAYGVLNQVQHIYLAEGLTPGEHARDPEESDLEVHRVPVSEFETMLLDGRVVDNCSAAAWGVYQLWRDRQKRG